MFNARSGCQVWNLLTKAAHSSSKIFFVLLVPKLLLSKSMKWKFCLTDIIFFFSETHGILTSPDALQSHVLFHLTCPCNEFLQVSDAVVSKASSSEYMLTRAAPGPLLRNDSLVPVRILYSIAWIIKHDPNEAVFLWSGVELVSVSESIDLLRNFSVDAGMFFGFYAYHTVCPCKYLASFTLPPISRFIASQSEIQSIISTCVSSSIKKIKTIYTCLSSLLWIQKAWRCWFGRSGAKSKTGRWLVHEFLSFCESKQYDLSSWMGSAPHFDSHDRE